MMGRSEVREGVSFSPRQFGLAARLLTYGLAVALLVSLVAGYALRAQLHDSVWRAFDQTLTERSERVIARIALLPGGQFQYIEPSNHDEFSRIFSGWYWQLESGPQTLRSRSLWDGALNILEPADSVRIQHAKGPQGEALIGRTRPYQVTSRPLELAIFGPAEPVLAELSRFDNGLGLTLLSLLLSLLLATAVQVRLGLLPLISLRKAVAEASAGHRKRVGSGYGPDLDPLARELDALFERNTRIVSRGRARAADLSHALKKPLAVLMGASSSAAGQVGSEQVRDQVKAMTSLIDRHLTRASSGAGERRRIDVGAHITALVEVMRKMHGARSVEWAVSLPGELDWQGEPTDLDEMLGNLLDNAGKWARSSVNIRASRADSRLWICIADDGPGLDDGQLARIARRGQRFDESVEGHGLGLAIVSDIADTYGGRLSFGRSKIGGLEVQLTLPD